MPRFGVAARALKALDHRLGRLTGHRRVLIDVRTPMNLIVLRPVWSRLHADPRVALFFVAEQTAPVTSALGEDTLADRLISRARARWMRFDLMMTADAWNHAPLLRCRTRLNFFHGVAGKYDLDAPARLGAAGWQHFDRVAFINDDRLRRYVASGQLSASQAALVGFPKLDDLINGRCQRHAIHASLGLSPSNGTVLYAPTFSTASSLHLAGPSIIEALLSTGRNVIVKLHDRSAVPDAKHTDGIDWPARLEVFDSHPRFRLSRSPDVSPLLAAADVLVTDHSSVGFEFALLDRPVVVFDAPALMERARVAPEKWALLRSMADVTCSTTELAEAVERSFTAPDRLREQRLEARKLFAYPGEATDRAMTVVYELLDLYLIPAAPSEVTASVQGTRAAEQTVGQTFAATGRP